ncbi:sigma-54 interaction domain-containing protein [Clostridium aminobutyricum]|uniref:Sigma 54-interacting transcriptional regulator n=1 Tax=Clostridium aminobutyricum TaxID=33953 RepID=A0A939D8L7_CLOAM|nr:sigma 54-interacting transcriptional regulator [Clostridium aminobutyricum]MBN7772778.1 sigma 54-interacting transcriptional regulator [Clostridium aminobutyricum]
MINKALNNVLNLYDEIDWIIIVNREGIVEYSTLYDTKVKEFKNENTTGMHLLEVYPQLKEEDSSILKVLKTGKPIFYEQQTLYDFRGNLHHIINSTVPIIDGNEIIGAIEVSKFIKMQEDNSVKVAENKGYSLKDMITKDPAMLEIKEKILRVAKTDSSVLISGETGTGKELVAQSIHYHSRRNQMPFVPLNCAAVPENLLESVLFGTVKGAFTGAENTQGLIWKANGGILFLDEIHRMPLNVQSKLLRFLEDHVIRRLGENEDKFVNVRILSAMNLPPMIAMEKNLIREDLFYRLSVVSIHIPPLRERKEDIPLLVNHFIDYYNGTMNCSIDGVSELVMNLFKECRWKGNVRELRYVIEGTFNLVKGNQITLKDLPDYMVHAATAEDATSEYFIADSNANLEEKMKQYEKNLITKAIAENSTYAEAARKLGITRQSLRYKIEKYSLNKK